jgi:hypothetical protein
VVPLRELAGEYSQFQEILVRDLENVSSELLSIKLRYIMLIQSSSSG